MSAERPLEVVIIGAGVAGLAAAYGLRQSQTDRIRLKVFEARPLEECETAGYPIHLPKDGRASLARLLTPTDRERLAVACQKLPAIHGGITVQTSSGKVVWRWLKDPGERAMCERHDLCAILRDGAGEVEYGFRVKFARRVGKGWVVRLSDGRMVYADVLVGADGMFSSVRRALHSRLHSDGFTKLPWTTVNVRTRSPDVRKWVKDEQGMNMMYGNGWSGAFLPVPSDGEVYVALTLPSPARSPLDGNFIQAVFTDPEFTNARSLPLYSASRAIVGRDRAVLIGDASHGIVPFCWAGASAGVRDAIDLVDVLRINGNLDKRLREFGTKLKSRNDPLIKQSKKVLWLSQGEVGWKKMIRGVAFWALEMDEKIRGERRRLEKDMEVAKPA